MLALLLFPLLAWAEPNWAIHCDYAYQGYPFSGVDLDVQPDGHMGPAARFIVSGAAHLESYKEVAHATGERVHGWVSDESPDNRVELVIYEKPTPQGQSKLVNHQVPFGQEVWGKCRI